MSDLNSACRVPIDTVYCGIISRNGVVRVYRNGQSFSPAASQAIRNHSPDGFQWGYCGSGPAQLALALLLDATGGNKECAADLYQDYKRGIVSNWDQREWVTTRAEILKWIADELADQATRCRPANGGES